MPVIIEDTKRLKKAVQFMQLGVQPLERPKVTRTAGRPTVEYLFEDPKLGELVLSKAEYESVKDIVKKLDLVMSAPVGAMTESEFGEMCRLAVPQLMDRAIRLAMMSEDPREVMAVAKEITDRGYGKVTKDYSHESEETDYLRRSWSAFPKQESYMGIIEHKAGGPMGGTGGGKPLNGDTMTGDKDE